MATDDKKSALRRIAKDLEQYVQTYCAVPTEGTGHPADQTCNDAALMLQEALDTLEREG